MSVDIREIYDARRKSAVCGVILRALPNWFGVEASIVNYMRDVGEMPFFAAFDDEKPVGFAAVKLHNAFAAEICVMGVLREYHRQGIGRALIGACEDCVADSGREYLTVKTLDESRESKSYEKTRLFYLSLGFRPLEVFPLLWDEDNPCLFMAKCIVCRQHRDAPPVGLKSRG